MPTPTPSTPAARSKPLLVDFALQGGGSHGAFTWGVLDRLLQEPWLQIDGISGTSAGAMNAAVLSDGYAEGGAEGGRAALEAFWQRVSKAAVMSPFRRGPMDILLGRWTMDSSPMFVAFDMASRLFSPYDLNPRAFNPLTDILAESINFERLVASPIKVFVTATNVRTGRGRVFRNAELTPDVLLASACLPTVFQAVEIEGDPYWDGGYSANPAVFPLFYDCDARDVLLVLLSPLEREGTPRTVQDIETRIAELGFSAHFMMSLVIGAPATSRGSRWMG